jgi:hypothetical protein
LEARFALVTHKIGSLLSRVSAIGSRLQIISCVVPAAVVSALIWVVADSACRHGWVGVKVFDHHVWAVACVAAVGLVPASAAALALEVLHLGPKSSPRWLVGARAAILAGMTGALVRPTALWTFSGARVSEQDIAKWGPDLLVGLAAAATLVSYLVLLAALRRQAEGRFALGRVAALALLTAGLVGVYVDLHVYVSLYAKLHTALEALSFVLVTAGVALGFRELSLRVGSVSGTLQLAAAAGLLTTGSVLASERPVEHFEVHLAHAFREPVYVGRQLQRLVNTRAFLRAPSEWHGEAKQAMADFEERYGLTAPKEDPIWDQATFHKSPTVRCDHCNVVVFYVDTLRYDTTLDPAIMPNVVQFRSEALSFDRTYATGSDTLASLPGLTGGQYGLDEFSTRPPDDLLDVAEQLGMRRILAIPQSANEFLSKLHPSFRFDEILEVRDYGAIKQGVWGYGADLPSAQPLVDVTLERLSRAEEQRSLTWLFNFEVHSWHELDDDYLAEAALEANLPTDGDKSWRYRAAAYEVDKQFGRLLSGLEDLGLAGSTIVIFVSDHGEGLGQDDFWRHGTVLWESVIRVPLLMRIPGVPPHRSQIPVSLADVAPTLVTLLEPPDSGPELRLYHGVDLLRHVAGHAPRRYPIVFVGRRRESLVRVGLLDHETSYKVVLPLETGRPELYDTHSPAPDALDRSKAEPLRVTQMLDGLVRSPVYPRHVASREASDDTHAN